VSENLILINCPARTNEKPMAIAIGFIVELAVLWRHNRHAAGEQ